VPATASTVFPRASSASISARCRNGTPAFFAARNSGLSASIAVL
jgi:hypothetical protein